MGGDVEGCKLLTRALDIEKQNGPDSPGYCSTLANFAMNTNTLGNCKEAKTLLEEAISIAEGMHGRDNLIVVKLRRIAGCVYHDLAEYEQARAVLEPVVARIVRE